MTKRLNLLKRLASTNWGSNKHTLRQLYTGYVRAVFDYSAPLQITASKHNQKKLDRKQNEALKFVCGALKSTPSSACEIDSNIEPLNLRRERSAALTLERYRRMEPENPCRKMITEWNPKNRIQKTSFLKKTTEIASKYKFPENRSISKPITTKSPNIELKLPTISKELHIKCDKSTPPNILKTIADETIDRYDPDSIKAYTDGSAENATKNGGYGGYICIPQTNKPISIKGPCGKYSSNYDAEIIAMIKTMQEVEKGIKNTSVRPNDITIFTDSQSALEAITSFKDKPTSLLEQLLLTCHNVSKNHEIKITLQWIPGHCGIVGNEKGDSLAKLGSQMTQPDEETTYSTAKTIAKHHSKKAWNTQWTQNETGRSLFKYQPAPNPKDAIHQLERRHQCNIFRLRTGHCLLNMHRNRLDPLAPPICRHCRHPNETVEHHLLYCGQLSEMRKDLLPDKPTISNCLYGNKDQLMKTSHFHTKAL